MSRSHQSPQPKILSVHFRARGNGMLHLGFTHHDPSRHPAVCMGVGAEKAFIKMCSGENYSRGRWTKDSATTALTDITRLLTTVMTPDAFKHKRVDVEGSGWPRSSAAGWVRLRAPVLPYTAEDRALFALMKRYLKTAEQYLRTTLLQGAYTAPSKTVPGYSRFPVWRQVNVSNDVDAKFSSQVRPHVMRLTAVATKVRAGNSNIPAVLGVKRGSGAYGRVYEVNAADLPGHKLYAKQLLYAVPATPAWPTAAAAGGIVVKVQDVEDEEDLHNILWEVTVLNQLRSTGVVPKLYASGYDVTLNKHFTYMQNISDGVTLTNWFEQHGSLLSKVEFTKIESAIAAVWNAGYAHGDMNMNNIMVIPKPNATFSPRGSRFDKVIIIDFGTVTKWAPPAEFSGRKYGRMSTEQKVQYLKDLQTHLDRVHSSVLQWYRGASNVQALRFLHTLVKVPAAPPRRSHMQPGASSMSSATVV